MAWPLVFRTAPTAASGGEVYRESTDNPGRDPFSGTVVVGNPPGTKSQTPIGASGGGVSTIPGDVPALYGGSRNEHVCDRQKLITFLQQNPDKAAAWAGVLGIDTADIATYIGTLTPLQLRADTRVTNHGFVDGHATSLQSVLQAGTAVLADDQGRPRVKCGCGNPLLDPIATPVTPAYSGDDWPGFDPGNLSAITSASVRVARFVVYDLRTGETFYRPRGTDGDEDQLTTPPAATTTEATPTPTPTPTPTVVACPGGTHRSGSVCVADAPPRCPDGQVREGGRCVPIRISCPDGSHASDDGASCVKDEIRCPDGTHLEHGRCVDDSPHCASGTYLDGDTCVSKHPCPTGTHPDGGERTCVPDPCPTHTHPVSDGTSCAPDPPCPTGTRPDSGETTCVPYPQTDGAPCPTDIHNFSGETTCGPVQPPPTVPCPANTHHVANGSACVSNPPPPPACPSNAHSIRGETTCAPNPPAPHSCPSGSHPATNGTSCITNPPAPHTCPPGTHPATNGTSCITNPPAARACPSGTVRDSSGVCQSKPPTTRRTVAPSSAVPAAGNAASGSKYRTPCLLPDGRQGVINRSTGTCIPVQ